jgi:hypothetical protein
MSIWFAGPCSAVISQPVNHSVPLARLCPVIGRGLLVMNSWNSATNVSILLARSADGSDDKSSRVDERALRRTRVIALRRGRKLLTLLPLAGHAQEMPSVAER